MNFIFHSEHASTDGAQAKLRSCLDLWWEKHSFEYCLKLRRWVHISVETITEFCYSNERIFFLNHDKILLSGVCWGFFVSSQNLWGQMRIFKSSLEGTETFEERACYKRRDVCGVNIQITFGNYLHRWNCLLCQFWALLRVKS